MTLGEWGILTGIVTAVVGAFSGILLLAMDERNRKKFASRDDLNDMGRKIEATQTLYVNIDDRVGAMETKFERLDERQTQHFERVIDSLENITGRLEKVSDTQQMQAVRIERLLSSSYREE